MGSPSGLFIDTPPGMPANGSTSAKPPATHAHAAMEHIHGTQMAYLMRTLQPSFAGLPTASASSSCRPPAGHSHPHHARRSTIASKNCRPNAIVLPTTAPDSAPSMTSTGEK